MSSPFQILLSFTIAFAAMGAARAQDLGQEEFVVIHAGRVITMAGPDLRNADILLVDGKVRLVGKDLSYPRSAKEIDARRMTVMPGMIHCYTRWQLPTYSRSGIHGDLSVAQEIYLQEIDFEPFLKAGFTLACYYANGTGIPGPGVVYRVAGDASNREVGEGYQRITMVSPGRDKKTLRDAVKKAEQEIEKVEKARKEWEEKQKKAEAEKAKKEADAEEKKPEPEKKKVPGAAEDEEPGESKEKPDAEEKDKPEVFTPPKIDPAVLPLVKWIRDKKGPVLLYEISSAADYLHLQDVLDECEQLPPFPIYIADSSRSATHPVWKQMGEEKSLVVLPTGIGTLPYTATRVNQMAELLLAGAQVVLKPASDSEATLNAFRIQLADLVRAGVPRDEVLKAVTLRPAELLGLQERFGSIEKGKEADFVFLSGDPLRPGSEVQRVMMAGEIVWEAQE